MIETMLLINSLLLIFQTVRNRSMNKRALKAEKSLSELAPKKTEPEPEPLVLDEYIALSKIARRVVDENDDLPADQKIHDLIPTLHALDVKHGKYNVDEHFTRRESYEFHDYHSWDVHKRFRNVFSEKCKCVSSKATENSCTEFPEYNQMLNAIYDVAKAHRAKERALELAGVKSDLDRVENILSSYRSETEILTQVSKDLSAQK